jgi:hypothetical protein
MFINKINCRAIAVILMLMIGVSVLSLSVTHAQEGSTPAPVTITGTIQSMNGSTVVISGMPIDISQAGVNVTALQPGVTVQVNGTLSNGGVVATTIVIITGPVSPTPEATPPAEETPEATPEATETPIGSSGDTIIVVEGPVQAINVNIITIYNFNIEVEPTHPILKVIKVGDILHVKGDLKHGKLVAIDIGNLTPEDHEGASVVLDGPIQAINGNIITINNVNVQIAPDDPRRDALRVGDHLRVEGNFQGSGNTIIVVVVNIIIVNINAPGHPAPPANCKISKNGKIKCSKKKK